MATDYSQLVNKDGTIFNTATNKAYSDPNSLASDLGVQASGIQWGSIAKNDAYNPTPTNQTQTPPPTGNQAGGLSFEAIKQSQQTDKPQFDQQGMLIPGTGGLSAQGYQNAKDSGKPAPDNAGEAKKAVEEFTPPAPPTPPDTSVSDAITAADTAQQKYMKDLQDYQSSQAQKETLAQEYTRLQKDSGIQALDTQLLNMKNVMNGTEDDIRNEVTKAGGFATESQVLALTSARNKSLIKNYNNLLDTRNNLQENLKTMIGLSEKDRAIAAQKIDKQLEYDKAQVEFTQKAVANAQAAYQKVIDKNGYAGLLAGANNDPHAVSLIEKTLGLPPGDLQGLAVAQAGGLGNAKYYKFPGSPLVYDANNKPIDLATYKAQTGQTNIPDAQVKFDGIKTIEPTSTAGGKLLTVAEAKSLGVPYGTTQAQAKGITPTKAGGGGASTGTLSTYQVEGGKTFKVTTKNGKVVSKVEQKGSSTPPSDKVQAATNSLKSVAGQDNAVSPEIWNEALNQWLSAGYSLASFKSNFGSFAKNSKLSDISEYTGM